MDMNTIKYTSQYYYVLYFSKCNLNMINFQIILAMVKSHLLPNFNNISVIIDCEDEISYFSYFNIETSLIRFAGMFYKLTLLK